MNWYWLGTIIFAVIGYLVGSISPAIIISNILFKKDVRDFHSKNAGATNSVRVLGKKWGILILILDILKPGLAVLIAWSLTFIIWPVCSPYATIYTDGFVYVAGLSAIIGHCFPLYFHFKGGKGAASCSGFLLIINPIFFLIAFCSWWIVFFARRIVSIASMTMMLVPFILSFIPEIPYTAFLHPADNRYYVISILIGTAWVLLLWQHRTNLKRLVHGTEPRFKFKKNKN